MGDLLVKLIILFHVLTFILHYLRIKLLELFTTKSTYRIYAKVSSKIIERRLKPG